MAFSANTVGTTTWRNKYLQNIIQETLKVSLVLEKICAVDRTDNKYIYNPYGSAPTTTIQTAQGTYSVGTYTITNDTLEVNTEFIVSEQIYGFEDILSNFDLFVSRSKEMAGSAATAMDKWGLNFLLEDATGTYTTASGGFTTGGNVNKIFADLLTKWAGYQQEWRRGAFIVVEASDLGGIALAQGTSGYSAADMALRNGFLNSWLGIEIYVVADGTFANSTQSVVGGGSSGTFSSTSYTNSGHRLAGIKNIATYASPRGLTFDEKSVSGATGKEIVCWGLTGIALWYSKAALMIDITVTA
jgi:hypothetical protein